MNKSISKILQEVSQINNHWDRIKKLKEYGDNKTLLIVLQYAFHPDVKFLLPETDPPFKPSQAVGQEGMLYKDIRLLPRFVEGGAGSDIPQKKRETLFVQFIESLDPKDAELLIAVKNKKIPYPGITYKTVEAAFPNLIPPTPKDNKKENVKN